jgi:SAM-dependent methyltransferase
MEHNMSDDISDIRAFYDSGADKEHARLELRQLEYELTLRYLSTYLPSEGSILEVGAATGRYTLELAKRGYNIVAVDLSAEQLEINRRNLAAAGLESQVQFVVADARDLSEVTGEFDAVLPMGPLYHLIVEADRKSVLKQAFERLRTGGVLISIFLSRFGLMNDLIRNNPGWIENRPEVESILARGRRADGEPPGGFRAYFAPITEIVPLHETVGFETVTLAGIEPGIGAHDEDYNSLEGTRRDLWLDLLYGISSEPSIMGASRHVLYVGRKG